ncbi:hypothetical protein SO802_010524 [Lithocarpus litseifolius]|uniref:Uncharacterized protein n=1 Tax=Lithocarpus litseifolius TaxID=425828 RepID=A0AAW2DEG3_9ROSI
MKQKLVIRVTLNNGKNSPLFLGWLIKKIKINNGKKNARSKAMQIAVGIQVRSISLPGIMSKRLVDTTSIASIFPPDRSDTESDTSSESNESCPRFSCSIDTIFPPARSPSQSDSSENYDEIFPIDPFIATSSRRTRPMRVVKALAQAEVKVQAQDGNADDRAAEAGDKAAGKRPVVYL